MKEPVKFFLFLSPIPTGLLGSGPENGRGEFRMENKPALRIPWMP